MMAGEAVAHRYIIVLIPLLAACGKARDAERQGGEPPGASNTDAPCVGGRCGSSGDMQSDPTVGGGSTGAASSAPQGGTDAPSRCDQDVQLSYTPDVEAIANCTEVPSIRVMREQVSLQPLTKLRRVTGTGGFDTGWVPSMDG